MSAKEGRTFGSVRIGMMTSYVVISYVSISYASISYAVISYAIVKEEAHGYYVNTSIVDGIARQKERYFTETGSSCDTCLVTTNCGTTGFLFIPCFM